MNMMIDSLPAKDQDRDIFLADVEADPKEVVNLAGDPKYADVVKKLVGMLVKHAEGAAEVQSELLKRDTKGGEKEESMQ
jgi:hypothetical protein